MSRVLLNILSEELFLTAVTPSSTTTEGGTVFFVRGGNFVNSALLSCRFGSLVTNATYLSTGALTCRSPSLSAPVSISLEVSTNLVDFFDGPTIEFYGKPSFLNLMLHQEVE